MSCPTCSSSSVGPLIDLGDAPVFCNVQWTSRNEALGAAKAPISLSVCYACGHVYNAAFDPQRVAYAPGYENSQHSSAVFRDYAQRLVERLVSTYGVRNSTVVDIGCGRGDLLRMLCAHGGNRGFGFDPSQPTVPVGHPAENVTISSEYFTAEQSRELKPSLVCCRHVLEHVPNPVEFLRTMRASLDIDPAPVLYLEVPNGEHLLENAGVWDYIYEHVSYFSPASLELALRSAGFEILALREDFDGQFLCAEVRVSAAKSPDIHTIDVHRHTASEISAFALQMQEKLRQWRAWAEELRRTGGTARVWGAGSKGVMFLNLVGLDWQTPVECIIDQNAAKHGRFVPGTAQCIVGPSRETVARVQQIVLMNPIYGKEVSGQLANLGATDAKVIAA